MPTASHHAVIAASEETKLLTNVYDGNPALGIPNGLNYVNYTDLYQTGDTVIAALARLTVDSIVMFPDGFDGHISTFAQYPTTSGTDAIGAYGLYVPHLQGMGASGPKHARLMQDANSIPQAGLDYLTTQNTSSSPNTTQWASMRVGSIASGAPIYVFGMTLQGDDQGTITDYRETGPARYQGFSTYKPGPNSIFQNLHIIGLGHSDGSSPPAETFAFSEVRSTNLIIRNTEIDGRIANGTRRSGMFGTNGASNITVENCYMHDSYTSGVTFSFAGSAVTANSTHDITITDVKIAHNANHTLANGTRFTGINMENVYGTITITRPDIQEENMTEWNATHIGAYCDSTMGSSTTMTVIEPTWHQSPQYNNGMFVCNFSGGSGAPTVIKNGVSLIPYTKAGSSTYAPAMYTPDKYFLWAGQ